MKKRHNMTWEERQQLEALRKAGLPVSKIARQLGFCRQTIYNELRKGSYLHTVDWRDEERYSAEKGQRAAEVSARGKGAPPKIWRHYEYAMILRRLICKEKYSPAAAIAEARKRGYPVSVCTATLYSYINRGIIPGLSNNDLLWKKNNRKRKPRTIRIAHPELPSIANRPEEVNKRTEYGHWEMDLIVGRKGRGPVLLTLTERMTRQELIFKLPNRKAKTIRRVFDDLERQTPFFSEIFKSITTDNGSEFLEYDRLTRSIHGGKRFKVWYCHSYAAWEKGSNENHNRMIRRFFPKGTDFRKVSKKQIATVQDWMNNYPRKILEWKTPNEVCNTIPKPGELSSAVQPRKNVLQLSRAPLG